MSWRDDTTLVQRVFIFLIGGPNVVVAYADHFTWETWRIELPFWSYVAWYPAYFAALISPTVYVVFRWWCGRLTNRMKAAAIAIQVGLLGIHAGLAWHFMAILDRMWETA